jgi:hypothetical protein
MVRTPSPPSLSALVRGRGVLTERALIEVVAGEPVRGSWWGHRAGCAIFHALEQLREDGDVFLCKLRDGKQTYVHRRLWPALLRLQAETSLWPPLSARARLLLKKVEAEGSVQATGRVRLELERALRVVARSEHTASGAHAVFLTPFAAHFSNAHRREAARLTLKQAQAALAEEEKAAPKKRKAARLKSSASRGRGRARR